MSDPSGNITIQRAEHDGITLRLSNYGAHALLRRLQGIEATSDVEADWVADASEVLEEALN